MTGSEHTRPEPLQAPTQAGHLRAPQAHRPPLRPSPVRYVGAEEVEDDGDPFEAEMPRLVAELQDQFAESAKPEAAIRANWTGLGYN